MFVCVYIYRYIHSYKHIYIYIRIREQVSFDFLENNFRSKSFSRTHTHTLSISLPPGVTMRRIQGIVTTCCDTSGVLSQPAKTSFLVRKFRNLSHVSHNCPSDITIATTCRRACMCIRNILVRGN